MGVRRGQVRTRMSGRWKARSWQVTSSWGHWPVRGGYNLRYDGRYVQIHDPDRYVVAVLPPEQRIDLDRDIRELDREAYRELIDE